MFSLPFSCHILYTARHHFHSSFATATRLWGRVPCYWPHVALPCPAAHAKLCFFLQIWWLSILLSIRQHSTHSPDVGRNTWIIFFSSSSEVLADLSGFVWSENLTLFTFFSRSHAVPPGMVSGSWVKCKMAFAQNMNYIHKQSQHRKLTNKSMCLNNITAILYFINYVRGLLVNGLLFFPRIWKKICMHACNELH